MRGQATGRIAFTNTQAPRIAASAASAVQGVLGLSNLTLPEHFSALASSATATRSAPATAAAAEAIVERFGRDAFATDLCALVVETAR